MIRTGKALAAVACGAMLFAACGDDGGEPSTTAAATTQAAAPVATNAPAPVDSGLAAAQAEVDKYSKADGGIGVTIPLTKKPEKKTFAWLECDVPTCSAYLTPGFKDATAALGWDLKIIPMKSTDPSGAFQTAIDAKVDFIASTGLATAQYEPQLKAANAAGIKVFSCFGTDDPSPDTIQMQCGDESFVTKTGPLMANWTIVDSKGAANVLVVSIPDFAVLVEETKAFEAMLKQNCAACTFEKLDVSLQDLIEGKIPAAVVSKLQANPKLNYVFNSFGDLPGGLTAAMKSAGLDKQAKVYGQDFSKFGLDEIVAGTMSAWSANPKAYSSWLMVDAAARLSVGMTLDEERASASLPSIIVDDATVAAELSAAGGDWFPPGAADAFKKLWGV